MSRETVDNAIGGYERLSSWVTESVATVGGEQATNLQSASGVAAPEFSVGEYYLHKRLGRSMRYVGMGVHHRRYIFEYDSIGVDGEFPAVGYFFADEFGDDADAPRSANELWGDLFKSTRIELQRKADMADELAEALEFLLEANKDWAKTYELAWPNNAVHLSEKALAKYRGQS